MIFTGILRICLYMGQIRLYGFPLDPGVAWGLLWVRLTVGFAAAGTSTAFISQVSGFTRTDSHDPQK